MTKYYRDIAVAGARNGSGLTATGLNFVRQVTHLPTHTPQRIVLVSNRLPFTVAEKDGDVEFQNSAGGVATGLHALLETIEIPNIGNAEYVWIGWPGGRVSPQLEGRVKSDAQSRFHAYPVFLSEQEIDAFYSGFCNKTIWPLFHYFPLYARYEPEYWAHYKKVNEAFGEAALEILKPGDLLWIHDYHLMLLPALIRAQLPDLSIGFFLHIPFPHYEIFRFLPGEWRRDLLEGLLGADLVGFHTFDYAQYFLRCVLRILGHENQMGKLLVHDRTIKVASFPMGVPFSKFATAADSAVVCEEKETLKRTLAQTKLILSVDRQDYSKGILNRLEGFETFLETNPDWRGKVTLLMVVVPSRIGIEDYERMKKGIEELVGRINGQFGSVSWTPILYQYRSLSFEPLVALYTISDVALVTPLRDGMNLIAKEYIASRTDQSGVLVLSEMAGAARELGEALIINPNNRQEIAKALKEALNMPLVEQRRRVEIMQNRLRRFDLARWAQDFFSELISVAPEREMVFGKLPSLANVRAMAERYRRGQRRLILLDYDGTLVPFADHPRGAKPPPVVVDLLSRLAADAANEVVIISGRDRQSMQDWFDHLSLAFAAEHGAWIKERNSEWKLAGSHATRWKERLLPLLEMYVDRLPGAFIEDKDFSLVWHYRAADPEQAMVVAREIADDLLSCTGNIDVQIVQGSKTVEIRNAGISKAKAAELWLSKQDFDFILAIGDDSDDEDIFRVLPAHAHSVRVGIARTEAQFNLREPWEVVKLLEELTAVRPHETTPKNHRQTG
ncbi:MAG TPA: bifunctional alpha,alpha-trehalose-phosphate synthase (UDP-forming)/trehalose-phosphatase [Candidatus Binatia bacterium]